MQLPSKLIENAVQEISKLPGIGKKTALRLALHLLRQDSKQTQSLADALRAMREQVRYCKTCYSVSDDDICHICRSEKRDKSLLCIVEDIRDLLAIENTNQYNGLYHVLGGVISPIDGIGPEDLNIDALLSRVKESEVVEVIIALNATMEGDTTAFYLTKKLRESKLKVSAIARGVPIGSELEFTDEVTLGRSITKRISFE
ncbi:MAG: recombination protein RecR [Bernardetiaceae bacterium]|nr:recombination protein RecR [Bernardetiaceae bacterium]